MRSVCLMVMGVVLAAPAMAGGGVRALLSREIASFQAVGSLDKAASALASAGKVKIVVDWDRLTAAGLSREARAVVRGGDMTLEQLLDLLVLTASEKNVPLGWHVDGEAIRITTRAAVEARRPAPPSRVMGVPPMRLEGFPATAKRSEDGQPSRTVENGRSLPNDTSATGARARGIMGGTPMPRENATAPARTKAAASGGMDVEFAATPLGEVVKHLRDKTDLDIIVNWHALEDVGIAKDSPVSLSVRNRSVGRVLDLVLDDVSGNRGKFDRLYYVIDDGVVKISTGTALNTTTKTTVTDISDLLMNVPNFKGPSMKLSTSANRGSTDSGVRDPFERDSGTDRSNESAATPAEQRTLVQEQIIQAIKNSIGDDMWQPDGRGTIQVVNNRLIITQTPLGYKLLATAKR